MRTSLQAARRVEPNLMVMRAVVALVLLVSLMAPAFSQVSAQTDRASRQYGAYIESRYPVVDDPALVDRVGRIVERVRDAINNTDYAWRFRVIDNPVPNAFALPNGWIYIHSGLIQNLPGARPLSDDELAFVLAHEMSHVVLGHSARESSASTSLQRIVTRSGVVRSQAASVLSTLLRNGVEASFSREFETEADQWAVTWTALAGYDPEAALTLFERMREYAQAKSVTLRIFHTHPSTADRIKNVRKWIGTKPVPTTGTIDGAPLASLPVTLIATAPPELLAALDPPTGTGASADPEIPQAPPTTPAEAAPQPAAEATTTPAEAPPTSAPATPVVQTATVPLKVPAGLPHPPTEAAQAAPRTCPVLPAAAVAGHLKPLLDFTNLVTLRMTAADAAALQQTATEKGAEAILVIVLDGIDQDNMPWPDGSVYSVCIRLTALLVRTRDGIVLQRQPLSAARRATLSTHGGLTREEVFEDVLDRALRPLDKPVGQALRALRQGQPAVAR